MEAWERNIACAEEIDVRRRWRAKLEGRQRDGARGEDQRPGGNGAHAGDRQLGGNGARGIGREGETAPLNGRGVPLIHVAARGGYEVLTWPRLIVPWSVSPLLKRKSNLDRGSTPQNLTDSI